jgi:uncharacterized membrane protein (UPF0136 family)
MRAKQPRRMRLNQTTNADNHQGECEKIGFKYIFVCCILVASFRIVGLVATRHNVPTTLVVLGILIPVPE